MGRPLNGSNATRRIRDRDVARTPDRIAYELEEALELLAALEDALEVVASSDYLVVVAEVENEVTRLHQAWI